jgi:hypothetical protein
VSARVAVALLLSSALAACGAHNVSSSACQRDDQCDGDRACAAGVCLPRAAPPASWAIEVAPPSESNAAPTEIIRYTAPAAAFDLVAGAESTLTVTVAGDSPALPLSAAHLVVSAPATIPGRPDLSFETELLPAHDAGPPSFSLQVPKALIGRAGRLEMLPLAPADAAYGPVRANATIDTQLEVQLPPKRLTVRGRLVSALGDPKAGFTARAFAGSDLVSNVVVTGADGVFTVLVPAPSDAAAPPAVTIEIDPATTVAAPRFSSKAMVVSANTDLGDVTLPAFAQPNVYHFVVHGALDEGQPIAGAVVRAWTLLGDDTAGRTDFIRAARTDDMGGVSLGLIPGTTNALRVYDVAVAPPPESPYGLRCIAEFPLSSGGTDRAPATLPPIVLQRRTVVSGTISDHDGARAAGVMVLATRTAADGSTPCTPSVGSAPATTTTDDTGTFALALDSGLYRLDLDPPAGSPLPRLTQTNVVVPSTPGMTTWHAVTLPAGAVVEGTVRGPDGMPVPLAAVRFFEPAASVTAEPALRAQTRADMQGHYRAVIPLQ